jgi:uncharacterized protein
MFTLDDGLILSLYPRSELAKDAGVDAARVTGSPFTIGHFVDSREQVDGVLAEAARAGGTVHGPTHERPWGIYSGHFAGARGYSKTPMRRNSGKLSRGNSRGSCTS